MGKDCIKHQGIVEGIDNQNIIVRIEQKAACKDCHAGSVCLAADKKDKIIEVNDCTGNFVLREEVIVSVSQSIGFYAVVFAYVVPLLLVILSVVAGVYASGSDAIGGLTGLLVLLPYYFVLYLLRDKFKKKFVFSLSKLPELLTK